MRKLFFLVAILAILALMLVVCDFIHLSGSPENGGRPTSSRNATWIDVDWAMEPHDPPEITALAADLRANDIHYVYAFVSYRKADGGFNPTYAYAAEFVRALKAVEPSLNVQAWIGLPLTQNLSTAGPVQTDLADPKVRAEISAFCSMMVAQNGFDGVHLDPEPVIRGDRNILSLLDEVRSAIGPSADLSVATRRIWPFLAEHAPPGTEKLAWDAPYYRDVAGRVDQIVVMTYDSALPIDWMYSQWVRFQVIEISSAIVGMPTEFLVGLPTSEEQTSTHRPNAENLRSGLNGVRLALRDDRARSQTVSGVAVYPHWETDGSEWATYEQVWLGR